MTPRVRAGCCLAVLALVLMILMGSMAKPVSRDEQMYCTAGVLLAQGHLPYRDFSYPSQLPYHPALLALVYRLTGTQWYLLTGRLLSVLALIVTLFCVVWLYGHLFREYRRVGIGIGLMACSWVVFNPLADYAFGHAWNHDIVIMCIMIALAVSARKLRDGLGLGVWDLVVVASILTLATWMRVTTALVYAVFALVLGIQAGRSKRLGHFCIVWLATTLAVSLWPLSVVMRVPQTFLLNLFEIPRLYGQWLQAIGRYHPKMGLTWACLTQPGMALLVVLTLLLWGRSLLCRQGKRPQADVALVCAIPVVLSVIALIPPTMWIQYWAVPVPFLVAGLAWPLSELWTSLALRRRWIIWGVIGMTLFMIVLTPLPLIRLSLLPSAAAWTPVHLHRTAQGFAQGVPAPRRMLTLAPLWSLEGGGTIYPELAAGSITYRIADQFSPETRAQTHTVGPQSLASLVSTVPPNAILVGCEDPFFRFLEDPLAALASPSWSKETVPQGPTVLFAP